MFHRSINILQDVFVPTPSLEDSLSRDQSDQLHLSKGCESTRGPSLKSENLELNPRSPHENTEDECNLLLSTSELMETDSSHAEDISGATQIEEDEQAAPLSKSTKENPPPVDVPENQDTVHKEPIATPQEDSPTSSVQSAIVNADVNDNKDCITQTNESSSQNVLVPSLNSEASLSILDQAVSDQNLNSSVESFPGDVDEVPETPNDNEAADVEHQREEGNLNLALSETQAEHLCSDNVEPVETVEAMEVDQSTDSQVAKGEPDYKNVDQSLISENKYGDLKHINSVPCILPLLSDIPPQSENNECGQDADEGLEVVPPSAHQKEEDQKATSVEDLEKPKQICDVDSIQSESKEKTDNVVPAASDCNKSLKSPSLQQVQHLAVGNADVPVAPKENQDLFVEDENEEQSVPETPESNVTEQVKGQQKCIPPGDSDGISIMEKLTQKYPDPLEKKQEDKVICGLSVEQANKQGNLDVVEDSENIQDHNPQPPLSKDVSDSGMDIQLEPPATELKDVSATDQKNPSKAPLLDLNTKSLSEKLMEISPRGADITEHQREPQEKLNPISPPKMMVLNKGIDDASIGSCEEEAHGPDSEFQEKTAEQSTRSLCESSSGKLMLDCPSSLIMLYRLLNLIRVCYKISNLLSLYWKH